MIQFDDALERAKLATDESGFLAPYTYNQLIEALPEEEQYPFTMALVELGIKTKWASYSKEERKAVQDFIDGDEDPASGSSRGTVASFIDRLVKVAQQFVQGPGGLWTPQSWQDDEETELTDEDLEEVDPADYEEVADEDILESGPLDEFSDYNSSEYIDQIRNVLENAGISVDKNGNVSFYQSNIPGIYTEQIPMKPMPLDLAYQRYYQSFNTAQKEQERVKGLLDAVSRMTPEMGDLLETRDFLTTIKFSPKSKNKLVQSIASGLGSLNSILTDPDWYKIQPVLDELKGNLETYTQQFSAQEDTSYEVLDALDRLKDLQENDPARFQEAVGGYGALAAFRRLHQVDYDYDYEPSERWIKNKQDEYLGGWEEKPYIVVDISRDYIREHVMAENPALGGEMLEEEVDEWISFFTDNFFRDVLDNPYYMKFCDDLKVNITEGEGFEVQVDFFDLVPGENFDNEDIEAEISWAIEGSFDGVYE